jgi:hypothetical protein
MDRKDSYDDDKKGDQGSLIEDKPENSFVVSPVEPEKNRFPLCLVWSPLPVITWFLPFIGHLGIANSNGFVFLLAFYSKN